MEYQYDGYQRLEDVFYQALKRAAVGKGKERHADGNVFEEQPICVGARNFGVGAPLFQAFKKILECQRLHMPKDAINELLDAMVYLAAAVIVMGENNDDNK